MHPPRPAPHSPPQPQPFATPSDAESLADDLIGVMMSLGDVLDAETDLVRAGRLGDAMRLASRKGELAQRYLADAACIRANAAFMAKYLPVRARELRQRHADFQPRLSANLTVLATAHAVSESIIRGAASELARKTAPKTYGSSGRAGLAPSRAVPVAVSRIS